ncbi:MAG TPA: DUF1501 domain-containing protein [Burkholderiaceae bacterium]|jgi:uncharacterized protein (DUF1501 family)|nr:DUF1501 domain-containing protein [Burkholderiaceae bacterium]
MNVPNMHRRAFLRKSALMSAVLGTAGPWALNLAAMSEAAAQTASDYKALVCVFLVGGNDYGNTLIPYDNTNYNLYQSIRGQLAYPQSALAGTVLTPRIALPDARQMALAPELAPLVPLFNAGNMGVVLNVGPLVEPTTLTQYFNNSVLLPPNLFSHIDQQTFWQSSNPNGATSGWGGRIEDLMMSGNGNSMFSGMSVSGNAVFLSGNTASQFDIGTSGPVLLRETSQPLFGSMTCAHTMQTLATQARANVLENAVTSMMQKAITGNASLSTAISGVPALKTQFDKTNSLATQLQMVAKLIAARGALGVKRQVFFVSLGGFDNHTMLMEQHPGLLTKVANAISSFYNATVELGVANQVTSFTASEFGRTLSPNGDGSDHGWGSHHFVVGGAVQGQSFYGTLPVTAVGGPDDVGQGRLLPSTAVDQLAASLASWLGVSASNMSTVLPYSGNFNLNTLNLFASQTST